MLKENIQQALNEQIHKEFASAYLYLSMAAHFDNVNLPGFAHWMKMQAREEIGHGMRLFEYVGDRGGRVLLKGLDGPTTEFGTPTQILEMALDHERQVTAALNRLYEFAIQEKDYATQASLQWFITEQVEEEKTAELILEQVRTAENLRPALLMLDRELATRTPGEGE